MSDIELDVIDHWDKYCHKKFILYGASSSGEKALKFMADFNYQIEFFCDSNSEKWNTKLNGVLIVEPEKMLSIVDNDADYLVLLSSVKAKEIKSSLIEKGLQGEKCVSFISVQLGIYYHRMFHSSGMPENEFNKKYECWKNAYMCKIEAWCLYRNTKELNCLCSDDMTVSIYNAGKVASTSIMEGLSKKGIWAEHPHSLRYLPGFMDCKRKYLYEYMLNQPKTHKIINIVREPIGRDISYLFEALFSLYCMETVFVKKVQMNFLERIQQDLLDCLNFNQKRWEAFDYFNTIIWNFRASEKYGAEFDWYNREIQAVFGINVFEYPFDKEQGYTVIKKDNIELLILKFEKLAQLEPVIAKFVGIPDFKLVHENTGSGKIYSLLYEEVKRNLKIPEELIDLYYKNNARVNHFYSESERNAFAKKWRTER